MLSGILFSIIIILWIIWRKKKLELFRKHNIPGPSPHFLFGNVLEINKKGLLRCQEEWIKKYGQIVGYYHGLKPVLLIADHDTLKRIFITDFRYFPDRPEVVPLRVHSFLDYIIPASKIMDTLLVNQKGEEWKKMRSQLSPIFSANKLKMVIPFVDKITETTTSILERKARNEEIVDIYSLLQCLTLDVISAQAFATHTNIQKEKENNFLFRSAKTIFDNSLDSKIITFGLCFPEFGIWGMVMNFLKMFFNNGFTIAPLVIANLVGKVIEQRRKNPNMRQPDLLQSLIDASEPDLQELKHGDNPSRQREKLTDLEIKSNALVVFLAGYETSSSALAYAIHLLAKYPEHQKKIQEEIDQVLMDKDIDYYILKKLHHLERFTLESMRFYPPAITSVLRVAVENVDLGNVFIPKGMLITVPVTYMHFNEDNWEEPQTFDPDRFLVERRTTKQVTSYWAFGVGPRNCIGNRLANIISKVILVHLLRRFTFELPSTPEEANLRLIVKWNTMVPSKVLVKVRERELASRTVNQDFEF